MNELVIGDATTGKTYINVANAVKNYQGRVILFESGDVREYLHFPKGFIESCTVNELEKVAKEDTFTRIQVIVDVDYQKGIAAQDVSKLRSFVDKYKNCDNLLLVYDDAQSICPFVQELVGKDFSSRADKMIVLQNLNCIANNYSRSSILFTQTVKELLWNWDIVYKKRTIHLY